MVVGTSGWQRNARRAFKLALERAGIAKDVPVYGLRSAHATLILETGGSIKAVQNRLRHSNLTVLNRAYAHISRAVDADVARNVGAALRSRKNA